MGVGSSGGARRGWLSGDGPANVAVCASDIGGEEVEESLVRALGRTVPGETRRFPPDVRRGEGDEKTSSRSTGMVFGLYTEGLSFALVDGDSPPEGTRLKGLLLTSSPFASPVNPILLFGVRLVYRTSGESFSLLTDTFRSSEVLLSPVTEGNATFARSFDTFLVPLTEAPPLGVLDFGRDADIPSPIAALDVAAAPVAASAACSSDLADLLS